MGRARRSSNWTSFSSPWSRAWGDHELVDLTTGRLALHYGEQNPDEVLAALDDKIEAVIRELEVWGRLVESAVGAHLVNAAAAGLCQVFYWRDRNYEVDFVVKAGK